MFLSALQGVLGYFLVGFGGYLGDCCGWLLLLAPACVPAKFNFSLMMGRGS